MNIRVFYHSTTGNTKKLADAISEAAGVAAEAIGEGATITEPVDLLFVGDGVYAGKPSKRTVDFISKLVPGTVKNVAVFATYGGQAKIGSDISALLSEQGLQVVGAPFVCRGQSWAIINRRHPDEDDLKRAAEYAKEVVSGII